MEIKAGALATQSLENIVTASEKFKNLNGMTSFVAKITGNHSIE